MDGSTDSGNTESELVLVTFCEDSTSHPSRSSTHSVSLEDWNDWFRLRLNIFGLRMLIDSNN